MSTSIELEVISSEKGIINALVKSKANRTVVAINSPLLGEGTYLTSVVDLILTDYESIAVLKPYDVTGYMLKTNSIPIDKISSVIPFTTIFKNPFFKGMAIL